VATYHAVPVVVAVGVVVTIPVVVPAARVVHRGHVRIVARDISRMRITECGADEDRADVIVTAEPQADTGEQWAGPNRERETGLGLGLDGTKAGQHGENQNRSASASHLGPPSLNHVSLRCRGCATAGIVS